MLEQHQPMREEIGPGSGGSDDPFATQTGPGLATVSSSVYLEQLPVAGLSVREIRERFADRLDIDPLSAALLDGHPADEQTAVRTGQVLMFIRHSGEKGRCLT